MPTEMRSSPLRERRKQETRDDIRRVALGLVQDRGYDAVTVDLISERAGVSVRTFFNYFANKESAMIAVPPPVPEAAVEKFLSRSGARTLFADFAELAVSMFEEDASAPSSFGASIQIVMSVPTLAKLQYGALAEREVEFVDLVARRLDVGPESERPAVIAAALTGAIRVACQRWSGSPDEPSFAQQLRACLTVLSAS